MELLHPSDSMLLPDNNNQKMLKALRKQTFELLLFTLRFHRGSLVKLSMKQNGLQILVIGNTKF